ncbi:GGDEF domain-containing protein [Colwellia sp. TT2012]|uniref:GGDEF domain-containing protein n=1 Tax=Colwellia sp. TT2012 TaxID=1720342 RepID=UPI00070AE6A6|nr:GGDEF domain-containing protein [Colwellia sp. TT2012]
MSSANRSHDLLALVIIDIDHFKGYNDTFGHPAGDVALVALANLLKIQMKRGNDAVFRLGGEEFALLYQGKSEQAAVKLIEDIRVAVESLDQYCNLEKKITISAGLLLINSKQNIAVESAYKLADKLLYQAKNSGRNKVVTSN